MKEILKTISEFPYPSSAVMERQLLGDIVMNAFLIPEVLPYISDEMFTETRKPLWKELMKMWNEGKRIDLVSVATRCGKDTIRDLNITGYSMGATVASVTDHAILLRDAYTRRKAYEMAIELLESSCKPESSETSLIGEADMLLESLKSGIREKEDSPIRDVINDVAEEIQETIKLKEKGMSVRVGTGFPTLDHYTFGGWAAGQLIILAARPSVGKTSIMLQMARAAAAGGFPAMILSLEMTKKELGRKFLYGTNIITPQEVMSGSVDWGAFDEAAAKIAQLPITINDTAKSLSSIVSKFSLAAQRGECKVAFVDYLGLMSDGEDSKLTLVQQVTKITKTLKSAAKRAGIPLIVLAQLNRDMSKEGRAPQLHDLRDSGSIEQDADIVIMLEQEKNPVGDADAPNQVKMWLRKNRQNRKEICITVQPNDSYSQFTETGFTL